MALIEVRQLEHNYASRSSLRGVSLSLEPGERVGLVGPNGAGKSTLLLHLAGVHPPPSGSLWLSGSEVTESTLPELRRRVGLVFQSADDMLFTTRVRDEVAFGPRHLGLAEEEVESRTIEALTAVGMEGWIDEVPQHMSAGQKRSIALAAVLAMRPEALLLDEPTSDLDPRGRRALLELLKGMNLALFVASHDLEFVLSLCSRVIVLDEGKTVADGPSREVLGDEPLMLAHGLERPHSLTPHAISHDHD